MTDINMTIDTLQRAFNEFKDTNNQRLSELEKGRDDPILTEKISKIDASLSVLQKEVDNFNAQKAALEIGGQQKDPEYNAAFLAHMKKGDIQAALNKGLDAEGGYLTPIEWDRTITNKLVTLSPMRANCRVQPISGNGFRKVFNLGGTTSGWVGETDERPNTSNPNLASLAFTTGEIYANPSATQQILDDSEINLETWLADEVQTEFALQEGIAFIAGDGKNKPNGLLTYAENGINAETHPFGTIKHIISNYATNISQAGTYGLDDILTLIYALRKPYRQNASFMMNTLTLSEFRKIKDNYGNYAWQPSLQAGQPSSFFGYSIIENDDMPDAATNSIPVAFGDLNQTYLIIDRVGIRVLRDPYTNKPYVSFYTTKRVGGGVINPDSMKFLKVA